LFSISFFFFFFSSTGVWTQGFHFEPFYQSFFFFFFFVMGFLKVRSLELFAWAGLELWSSWSLPPE
jgi:hypothetical protein